MADQPVVPDGAADRAEAADLAVQGGPPALSAVPPLPSWPVFDQAEEQALLDVLRSGQWGSTSGTVGQAFEAEFAAYHDARYAVALSNGTLAIVAALRACGVGVGDEVIVPPYTFIATASAALFVGAVPVFADVRPDTHLLDPAGAEAAITERTKAIVPVHLAGAVADMDAFADIGRRRHVAIIEDGAQATGAAWRGTKVGALGDVGTFSFQSSKNITAGEGGIALTNDERLANRLYSEVNVGRVRGGGWYEHASVGHNLRLTEFQSAILRVQLERAEEQHKTREANARDLTERLADVDGITVDTEPEPMTAHGRHLFMTRLDAAQGDGAVRDAAVAALAAEGLAGASSGYVPLHRNEALRRDTQALVDRLDQPAPQADCPVADAVATDTIWFPQNILLGTAEQTAAIAGAIAKVVARLGTLETR